ncbi:MAG TPA: zf-HC2 domain-containing protein [Gemmatimonadales bacterium]|jgi:anti-sigma factor (TIGR02949 family)
MTPTDRLTCGEVFQRLDDFLDRELGPEDMRLVREHLDICLACAAEHRFERGILDGVKEKVRRLSIPEELIARVQAVIVRAR